MHLSLIPKFHIPCSRSFLWHAQQILCGEDLIENQNFKMQIANSYPFLIGIGTNLVHIYAINCYVLVFKDIHLRINYLSHHYLKS